MRGKNTLGIWRHLATTNERTQGGPTHPVDEEVLPLSNYATQATKTLATTQATKPLRKPLRKPLATKTLATTQATSNQDTSNHASHYARH